MWRFTFVAKCALPLLYLLSAGCAEDIPEPLTEEDLLDIIGPQPDDYISSVPSAENDVPDTSSQPTAPAPKVIRVSVAEGQSLTIDSPITVMFSEKMRAVDIIVSDSMGTMSLDATGKIATWTSTRDIRPGVHTLTVTGIGTSGQKMEGFKPINFTVIAPDTRPPGINDGKCDPENGIIGLSPFAHKKLVIVFNEPVVEARVLSVDPRFPFAENLSWDGMVLTLTFLDGYEMSFETEYRIALSAKDEAGNEGKLQYEFTTMKREQ